MYLTSQKAGDVKLIRGETMALFKKKEERAETPVDNTRDSSVVDLFSFGNTVTREQALQIPTVQACINKIADSVSMLPVKLYRKTDGKPEEVLNDKRVQLLNGETGDTLNTVEFWKALINDYYVGEGGWAYIHTVGTEPFSIHYVDSRNVSIQQNTDPVFKAYQVMIQGKSYYDFKFIKLLRKTKDGYRNIPIQEENSKVISAAYNALKLEISMSKSGGTKGGFLKSKNKLSKDIMDDIRRGYESLYDSFNQDRNRKVLILNDGMDFQEVSATSAEMQVNENKKTNAIEICKIFGFPHTIIDGGASEEDRRQYVQAITAILTQIETELDSKLLLEEEKADYYWAFDTKELTRGSQKERYEAYAIGLKNHFLQPDEVRKEEDYEPMGFNYISIGLGDVLLDPATGMIYTPNTNKMAKINEGGIAPDNSDEVRGYNPHQPREPNGRFASCDTGGGFGGKDLSTETGKTVDKSGVSGIIAHRDEIISDFKSSNFNGEIHIPPKEIDIESLTFDSKHINEERGHSVTETEAKSFIKDAKISFKKSTNDGVFENYISENGSSYVDVSKNQIRTAFKKEQFTAGTKRMLRTLEKYE